MGTYDIFPTKEGVEPKNVGRATVPDSLKAELKRQAEREGGSVSQERDLDLVHDLDTRGTETRIREDKTARWKRALTARSAQSRASSQLDARPRDNTSELGDRYARLMSKINAAQATKAANKQRRRSSSRSRESNLPIQLPTIELVQDPIGVRRVGGL